MAYPNKLASVPDHPPVSGISELVLEVSDLDRARRFYREVLGFEETLYGEGREGRYWYLIGDAARDERRRRKVGSKPRVAYLANSLSRSKPWEADGISRRTWERRRQKPAVASPRQIKLRIRERTLASRTNAERHQGRASHGATEDRQGSTEVKRGEGESGHERSS